MHQMQLHTKLDARSMSDVRCQNEDGLKTRQVTEKHQNVRCWQPKPLTFVDPMTLPSARTATSIPGFTAHSCISKPHDQRRKARSFVEQIKTGDPTLNIFTYFCLKEKSIASSTLHLSLEKQSNWSDISTINTVITKQTIQQTLNLTYQHAFHVDQGLGRQARW